MLSLTSRASGKSNFHSKEQFFVAILAQMRLKETVLTLAAFARHFNEVETSTSAAEPKHIHFLE